MFGSNAYVSAATTTWRKIFQIASRSASVAGRIFIDAKQNCRATTLVAAIPTAISAQATQRPRRAFARRAMVPYLPALIGRDLVAPVAHHRSTAVIALRRGHKHHAQGERQCEFPGLAKFPPQPTEITGLPAHARECAD